MAGAIDAMRVKLGRVVMAGWFLTMAASAYAAAAQAPMPASAQPATAQVSPAPSSAAVPAAAPAPAARPVGWSDLSYYLPMRDGVRIALSLWFPGHRVPASRVPVVLIQTRYGRGGTFTYVEGGQYRRLLDAGYAVAIVDTRGSTASFGDRLVEIGPEEVRDMDAIVRHLQRRPWSNGQVFATGVSYMADTADIATGSPARIAGAVVRQADFDGYLGLFAPGGVANDMMMNLWGGATIPRDYGRSIDPAAGLDCGLRVEDCPRLWPRLQPVDEDADFALVRAAFAGRRHWQPTDYAQAEFRDDQGRQGYTMLGSTPAAYLRGIRRQAVPVQYWGSWMDAGTGDAALARFRSTPGAAVEVWITANDHNGQALSDPFRPAGQAALPSLQDQWTTILDFLGRVRGGQTPARRIHYYVLGAGEYRTTASWPPDDTVRRVLRFGSGRSLSDQPQAAPGVDEAAVDFAATTGTATRWTSQLGTPAAYPDRASEDARLIAYTSEPFEQDMELAGTPAIHLRVATSSADPAFFVYLSDVAPDGRVTYLTEGLFRAVHRRPASQRDLPYAQPEPVSSYRRADALPVVPGAYMALDFPLFSVAALVRRGHRLRVSLAGADSGTFRRYSGGGAESWRIAHGGEDGSRISIDLRPWRGQ